MIIETRSAQETYELGLKIGKEAKKGQVYTMVGDLGSWTWDKRTNQQSDIYHCAGI